MFACDDSNNFEIISDCIVKQTYYKCKCAALWRVSSVKLIGNSFKQMVFCYRESAKTIK